MDFFSALADEYETESDEGAPPSPPELVQEDLGPCSGIDVADIGERLQRDGYRVWREAVDASYIAELRRDVELLFDQQMMETSRNNLAVERNAAGKVTRGHLLGKRGVHELDIVYEGRVAMPTGAIALDLCPAVRRFVDEIGPRLAAQLTAAFPTLRLSGLDTVKVQLNEGDAAPSGGDAGDAGRCFPMHYDTSSSFSRRAVTMLIYLNDEWSKDVDGGELRIYPFPFAHVDVSPKAGTAALFAATETLHRVMPSKRRRLCLSVWFASEGAPGEDSAKDLLFPALSSVRAAIDAADVEEETRAALAPLLPFLRTRLGRRMVAKVHHRVAYRTSFLDAFGDNPKVREALAVDARETDAAEERLGDTMVRLLRGRDGDAEGCAALPLPAAVLC